MQESSMLNERMTLLVPAAVYALSSCCAPFKQCHGQFPWFCISQDVNIAMSDWVKVFGDLFVMGRRGHKHTQLFLLH